MDGDSKDFVANTLKGQAGKGGSGIRPEHNFIAAPLVSRSSRGKPTPLAPGHTTDSHLVVAAPLSHGSNPNSNAARRRREDDFNLVYGAPSDADRVRGTPGAPPGLDDPARAEPRATLYQGSQYGVGEYDDAGILRAGRIPEHQMIVADDLDSDRCAYDPLPDGPRYSACGDAVTASVAEWIGRRLLRYGLGSR